MPQQDKGQAQKRNRQQEETAVLAWLAVPENRNIVTGAAGSAQNNGGLASKTCVVSKDTGWVMLAKHLTESTGIAFDKKQAANKFQYLEAKFRKAKIWQATSGVGIEEEDRKRGITDIPAKLRDICPQFELWDSWFGCWQKYQPSSIVASSAVLEEDSASDEENCDVVVRAFDDQTGGPDAELEVRSTVSSPSSPAATPAAVSSVTAVSAQKKQLQQAVVSRMPVVSSPSVSSSGSGSGKSNSFDVTYAQTQEKKFTCMKEIENAKCASARLLQNEDHVFQSQSARDIELQKRETLKLQQVAEHAFQARRDAISAASNAQERVVRQKIEFEKNVASLLIEDHSGKLADDFLVKCASRAPVADPLMQMLSEFMSVYAQPPAPP
jgi:hypothetical protein